MPCYICGSGDHDADGIGRGCPTWETPMTDLAAELVASGRNPEALLNQCKIFERGLAEAYVKLDQLRRR